MQGFRRRFAHQGDGPADGGRPGRVAPEGMPRQVPEGSRVPRQTQKPKDVLPTQQPITDEVAIQPPARWKVILKRVGIATLLLFALVMAYLFLLLGEPANDTANNTTAVQEEVIRVPMAAVEAKGDADMNTVAATFGQPVLVLYGNPAALQKITLSDTAFQGGYARRATLTYAFDDGQPLTVESIRPTAAAALLRGNGYTLLNSIYSMAGMEAVCMENGNTICVLGKTDVAVYAILFPASHEADVSALVKQAALWQPQLNTP